MVLSKTFVFQFFQFFFSTNSTTLDGTPLSSIPKEATVHMVLRLRGTSNETQAGKKEGKKLAPPPPPPRDSDSRDRDRDRSGSNGRISRDRPGNERDTLLASIQVGKGLKSVATNDKSRNTSREQTGGGGGGGGGDLMSSLAQACKKKSNEKKNEGKRKK